MKNRDFQKVYSKGKSVANNLLVLYVLENSECLEPEFGFVVSKKIGNSVVRHRVTRKLREICRLNPHCFSKNTSYVVIARKPSADADYHSLEKSLLKLAGKQIKK